MRHNQNFSELYSDYYIFGIVELCKRIGQWRERKGFKTSWDNVDEKLLLIHCEVSEAVEELRNDVFSKHFLGGNDEFQLELADIAIRLFDLADGCGVDLAYCIAKKMEQNEGRPYKHGKVF